MKKEFLCIDVLRAGISYHLDNIYLSGYKFMSGDNPYYYKNVILGNGTVITIGYYYKHQYLFVKCSLPKVIYGNNRKLITVGDIDKVSSVINQALSEEGITTRFEDFMVSNVEISFNYICSSLKDKEVYVDLFNKKSVSRRKNCEYGTSAVIKNKSCRTTVYDKESEELYRNQNLTLTDKEKRYIRVEHKVPKRVLWKYKHHCTVKDLFNMDLKEVLREENIKVGLDMKILNKKEFYKVLNEKIQHKDEAIRQRIIAFYEELNEYGENYVKGKYSRYIFNSYRNIMLEDGINTVHTNSNIKNVIDFQKVDQNTFIQFTKQEIKRIISKIKGGNNEDKNEKSYFEKMVEFKPFCLLCKFLFGPSGRFVDTS